MPRRRLVGLCAKRGRRTWPGAATRTARLGSAVASLAPLLLSPTPIYPGWPMAHLRASPVPNFLAQLGDLAGWAAGGAVCSWILVLLTLEPMPHSGTASRLSLARSLVVMTSRSPKKARLRAAAARHRGWKRPTQSSFALQPRGCLLCATPHTHQSTVGHACPPFSRHRRPFVCPACFCCGPRSRVQPPGPGAPQCGKREWPYHRSE